MPVSFDFNYPRRYNSLRLLGFDYTSTIALYFITMSTDSSRPVFGDIKLAKAILASLLDGRTLARIRVCGYTLMPDHFHLLAGVIKEGKTLSSLLGAFKSYTTQLYWKRSREVFEARSLSLPPVSVEKSEPHKARELLYPLSEWRVTLRPESVEMKNRPALKSQHFLSKHLWHRSFHEHVIRNEADLRETIDYIALNPVKRGYVLRPEFYPFTGFVFNSIV